MQPPPPPALAAPLHHLVLAAAVGAAATAAAAYWFDWRWRGPERPGVAHGVAGLVGGTPLLRIASLSAATGCDVLAKYEAGNPGGSVKDRVALEVLRAAAASGRLAPGGTVTEGSVGSTGVSLATLAPAHGFRAAVWMPDDAAVEKVALMAAVGAAVTRVRPAPFSHPEHFVRAARTAAAAAPPGAALFADQFENPANAAAHERGTGPELWRQAHGRLDAFVCGAGTGGTLAGVGAALKKRDPRIKARNCGARG